MGLHCDSAKTIAWVRCNQGKVHDQPMFKRPLIIWFVAILTLPVLGQQESAGPLRGLTFTANNEFSYDDNVLRQPDDRTASRVWIFNPRLMPRSLT